MLNFFSRARAVIKGWKTVIFHALYGLPATLVFLYTELSASGVDVTQFLPTKYVALGGLTIAVIGILLRLITTGPISSKEGLGDDHDALSGGKEPL